MAVVLPPGKATVAGTVATEVLSELRFTVKPPAGAGDARVSVALSARDVNIVTLDGAKLRLSAVVIVIDVPKDRVDLSRFLRQTVKSQNSLNGEFDSWDCLDGSSRRK
jgi:hypothetical protein